MTTESFCPILSVITIDDIEEIVSFICKRPQPLALYYFGAIVNNKRLNMVKIKLGPEKIFLIKNQQSFVFFFFQHSRKYFQI